MRISKTSFYLLLIFILALSIRLFAAYYIDVGSDEMIYSVIPLNILSSGRISTVEQGPVYFFMTDIIYNLFGGMTTISIRLLGAVFGALSCFLVFLWAKHLFGETQAGLWSAFLFALSGYAIRFNTEMDMLAFFFALLGMYLLVLAWKGHSAWMVPATLFLALGVLVKPFILLFAISFVAYALRKGLSKKALQLAAISLGVAVLVVMPVLAHNYILYQERGVTDYYFSVVGGIGDNFFEGMGLKPWELNRLGRYSVQMFNTFLQYDSIILIFGLLGMAAAWKKKSSLLLLSSVVILFVYLAGKTGSSSHYIWPVLVLSIYAGKGLELAGPYANRIFKNGKVFSLIVLAVIIVSTFLMLNDAVEQRNKSLALELRDYTLKNIPEDSLVVFDPRIYRGIYAWALSDRHYLEGTSFRLMEQLPRKEEVQIFYIECAEGYYCGWKPEDHARVYEFGKSMSDFFAQSLRRTGSVKAVDELIIYEGAISTDAKAAYEIADRTHQLWFTPVGWKFPEMAYDYFVPSTPFRKLLFGFAKSVLFSDVLIAFLSPLLVFYLLWRRSD